MTRGHAGAAVHDGLRAIRAERLVARTQLGRSTEDRHGIAGEVVPRRARCARPGMCPARGSIGSESPRYRSAARASRTSDRGPSRTMAALSRTHPSRGRATNGAGGGVTGLRFERPSLRRPLGAGRRRARPPRRARTRAGDTTDAPPWRRPDRRRPRPASPGPMPAALMTRSTCSVPGHGWRPDGQTAPAPGRGEVRVHVEEHGAGDVPGLVGVSATARGVEIPAHVRHAQVGRAELRGQPFGGDERLQGEGRGRGGRSPPKGESIFL